MEKAIDLFLINNRLGETMKGRPPKKPEDRRDHAILVALTAREHTAIVQSAKLDKKKPATYCRDRILSLGE